MARNFIFAVAKTYFYVGVVEKNNNTQQQQQKALTKAFDRGKNK